MIIDTSAAVAILYREPEAEAFARRLGQADIVRMSIANWLELIMLVERQLGADAAREAELFLASAEVTIEPVSVEQGRLARQAFLDFGRGRHPAALNFGDCFAYALAKLMGEPLLFKGDDFSRTDIRPA